MWKKLSNSSYLLLLIIVFSAIVFGCNKPADQKSGSTALKPMNALSTVQSDIISDNSIDYDGDGKKEELIVRMVEGKYYEDTVPGPFSGWKWEGRFHIELKDSAGQIISICDFNKAFPNEVMVFTNKFNVGFEDYNDDGCTDFTIGQYASSNGYLYRFFSINKDGTVTMLPPEVGTGIFNDNMGYSAKFKKVDKLTFKTHCYDNSKGKWMEYRYKWVGDRFENVAFKEMDEVGDEEPIEEQDKIEPYDSQGRIENLTKIEVQNLNDKNNRTVKMNLVKGWTATGMTMKIAEDFEYNDMKNKGIRETYEYIIYDENKQPVGRFCDISLYKDKERSAFPNHMQWRKKVYEGNTKLGKGEIYLLKLDLPDMEKTKDKDSFYQYYALIPINNEELAYNLHINVLSEGKMEDVLSAMKYLLDIS